MASHPPADPLDQSVDFFGLVGDEQHHIDGPHDACAITSDFRAMLFKDRAFACEDLRAAPHVPVIGVFGNDAKRDALTTATYHQFGIRFLHGFRIEWSI